jgi:hypothetical protein
MGLGLPLGPQQDQPRPGLHAWVEGHSFGLLWLLQAGCSRVARLPQQQEGN